MTINILQQKTIRWTVRKHNTIHYITYDENNFHRESIIGFHSYIFLSNCIDFSFNLNFFSFTLNNNNNNNKWMHLNWICVLSFACFLHLIAVCNQFARGVFTMLGAVSPESFDTLHSYSNTFQMPFVTPWFPEEVSSTPISNSIFFIYFFFSTQQEFVALSNKNSTEYEWRHRQWLR